MKKSLIKKSMALSGLALAFAPLAARAEDMNYDYSTTAADTAAAGGIIASMLIFWGVFALVALGLFIFWIIMLVDALKRTNWTDDNQKNMWIIILVVGLIVGLGGIAAIVYYFAVKRALDKPKTAPVVTTNTEKK